TWLRKISGFRPCDARAIALRKLVKAALSCFSISSLEKDADADTGGRRTEASVVLEGRAWIPNPNRVSVIFSKMLLGETRVPANSTIRLAVSPCTAETAVAASTFSRRSFSDFD